MPRTRSRTDNIHFLSSQTGTHILDAYLESCEKGGKELGALLDLVFDENGNIRPDMIEFRENPEVQGELQTRPYIEGQGPDENWTTVIGFQWVTEEAERARDWAEKIDGRVETDPDPEVGYSAKYWARRLALDWDNLGFYYLGAKATPPTTMNDGTQLRVGASYYDSTFKRPFYWSGTAWGTSNVPAAAVSVTLDYVAAGGQSQFDLGTPDVHGVNYTLNTVSPFEGLDVFKNGSRLVFNHDGGTNQYQVNYENNRVTLNTACTAGDSVQIDVLVPEERLALAIKRIHLLNAFVPDGVTTVWPLQRADIVTPIIPTSAEEIELFVDNVRQVPGTDYTVSGSDAIWTKAPKSYEEVWGLWNQPGGDADGEYRLDRDPDPELIGDLNMHTHSLILEDAAVNEVARVASATDDQGYAGIFTGQTLNGAYDASMAASAYVNGTVYFGGTQINAKPLAAPAGKIAAVHVDENGNLFSSVLPDDWSLSDTSAAVQSLGTGETTQPWVAVTDLAVTTTADATTGGILSLVASLYIENQTDSRTGVLEVGFGLDGADPAAEAFRDLPLISGGYAGIVSVAIDSVLGGTITTGSVIAVMARVASGSHATFGVNANGAAQNHSMLLRYEAP